MCNCEEITVEYLKMYNVLCFTLLCASHVKYNVSID